MSLAVPASVLAFRYSVTFIDSTTPLDFPARAELVQWVAERREDLTAPMARKGYAADLVTEAERHGSAEGSVRGMAYLVEAWQYPTLQGEADDVAEYLAATYPVGTPVTATDAMNRDVVNVGRISAHGASLVVAWTDGSTTEGQPFDMARMLTVADASTVARVERARDEAEAERITTRARKAAADTAALAEHLARNPQHAANFDTAPLVLDVPERVHRTDTFRATSTAGDMLSMHRFAFRTTSVEGTYGVDDDTRAVVDPGWTAHDAADTALRYVVDVLRVTEAVALAAMLAACAATDPWETAAPITDTRGLVAVWCSAVVTND